MERSRIIRNSFLYLLLCCMSCNLSACGKVENENNKATEMETKNVADLAYQEMYRAMSQKDSVGMENILDDTFTLMHMTGMHQSKPQFIRAVLDGTLNYYGYRHEEFELVSEDEDTITGIGRTRVEAAVFGGGRNIWRLQQRITLIRRDNKWLISETQASTY